MHIAYKGNVLFTIITNCKLISYMKISLMNGTNLIFILNKITLNQLTLKKIINISLKFCLILSNKKFVSLMLEMWDIYFIRYHKICI